MTTRTEYPECLSCGIELRPEKKCRDRAAGKVPTIVDSCWNCWSSMTASQRMLIAIAIKDRFVGGVLAEMAAALDRLDLARNEDEPGENWGQLD